MNSNAMNYLVEHAIAIDMGAGIPELFLPVGKIQGVLDLMQPGDIPLSEMGALHPLDDDDDFTTISYYRIEQ